MGKFYKEALKYKSRQKLLELNEIIAILNRAKAGGKSGDDPDTKEKVSNKLLQMESKILKEIDMLTKRTESENIEVWDFSCERKMDIFAEDDVVILRPLQEHHKELYIQIKKENANMVLAKSEEEQIRYWNEVWEDTKAAKYS